MGAMANRLADATSPYLLQHKDNPVDWWPWSAEAFAEAGARDVPILLSRRVRGLPLVPRHGARVVRGRRDGGAGQRRLRRGQGGPGGAPGRRRRLHGGHPGHDRPGRLADDLLPHPGRGAVLLRDVLPEAGLPAGPRRGRRGLAGAPGRGPGDRAADRHRALGAARADPGAAGRGRAGPGGRGAAGRLRRGARRLRRRAEVPAVDGAGVPAAPAAPAPATAWTWSIGTAEAMARGGMYDQLGRRLRALLGRRRLGGAALREDALRQRPAAAGLPAPVAGDRLRAGPPGRRRDRGVPAAATSVRPRVGSPRPWTRTPPAWRA